MFLIVQFRQPNEGTTWNNSNNNRTILIEQSKNWTCSIDDQLTWNSKLNFPHLHKASS